MKASQKSIDHYSIASMKIGYVMQNGAPDLSSQSGPQLHVRAIVEGFRNLGHKVKVVATQDHRVSWSEDLQNWNPPQYGFSNSPWFRYFESPLRRVQYELGLPFVGIFDSLRFADVCVNHLDDYDILYERFGYMGYGGIIASRILGIPLILELNGNVLKEIDLMGVEMSPLQRRLGVWLTRRTLMAANLIIAVSASLKHQLVTSLTIPEHKVMVVLNGADIDLFRSSFDERLIRSQYHLEPGPIVTFVGSIQPWHGIDLLLSSFVIVQDKFPESQLILVGEGEDLNGIVHKVSDLGLEHNVKFLGRLPQEEVAAVLSTSDVAVAPYPYVHNEIVGTPLKIIEYMAAGKAIVASEALIHEVIIDGITGLRVKPADEHALSQGIIRLIADKDLREYLGINAALQAEQYSWERVVGQITNNFDIALQANTR